MAAGKPAIHLSVEGEGLAALQRKMKALTDGKILARELNKAMREIAKELIPDAQASARANLPKGGGLNEFVANSPFKVVISASKREPGVKIKAKGGGGANRGFIRHPVFADQTKTREDWTWVRQPIDSGWFTETMQNEAPKVRPKLLAAMERTAEQIARA